MLVIKLSGIKNHFEFFFKETVKYSYIFNKIIKHIYTFNIYCNFIVHCTIDGIKIIKRKIYSNIHIYFK